MTRSTLLERSLAVVDPLVAAQLHPTRNGSTTARAISAGSPARLWWRCPAGHEWEALVSSRTRGSGCPYCAGRLPTPDTCQVPGLMETSKPGGSGWWQLVSRVGSDIAVVG